MGKIVAFWSPYTGRSKVTASLCAVAGAFGMWYPEITVAISSVGARGRELEERLDNRAISKQDIYRNFGIMALALNYKQSILTSEKIKHCAVPLQMNSLNLFPGEEKKGIEAENVIYRMVTEYLAKEYTCVFLEVESGHGITSDRFLQAADYIVIVLPQSPYLWERFLSEEAEWIEKQRYGVLLGGFFPESRFGLKYFKNQKEEKMKGALVGGIPMNVGFMDAMQEGKTLDFFLRNQLSRKSEENYEFMVQTQKAAKAIKKEIFLF